MTDNTKLSAKTNGQRAAGGRKRLGGGTDRRGCGRVLNGATMKAAAGDGARLGRMRR